MMIKIRYKLVFEPESDHLSEITSADESCCCGSFLVLSVAVRLASRTSLLNFEVFGLYSIWKSLGVFWAVGRCTNSMRETPTLEDTFSREPLEI
jgi:hypothetical protein